MKKKAIYDILAILSIILLCYIYTFVIKCVGDIDGDSGNGYWAVMAGNARTFMNGEFPLWSPYLWGGYVNAGSIFGCFYPIFYLLYIVFWSPNTGTLSYSFLVAVDFINLSIFGCGIYILNNKVITSNKICSWICAVLATFCGCILTGYHWAYIFIGFSWIPLFLFAYINSLEKELLTNRKWIIISAVILAMVGFGSTSHGLLFLAVCMFLMFASFVLCNPSKFMHYFKTSLIIGFLGLGLCAIQLLPFIQNMMLSYRYVNSESGILDYAEYMRNVIPASDWHQLLGSHTGWYAMSLMLFLLAIISLKFKSEKCKEIKLFAIILFSFTICMVSGAFLPDLMWHIPGIKQMREQFLWTPYLSISCGILAGISFTNLLDSDFGRLKWKLTVVDFVVGFLFIISLMPENNDNMAEWFMKFLLFFVLLIYFVTKIDTFWKKHIICIVLCLYTLMDYMEIINVTQSMSVMTADEASVKTNDVNTTMKYEFELLDMKKGDRILSWSPSATYPGNAASVIGYYDCLAYMNPIYEKNWYLHSTLEVSLRCLLQNVKYVFVSVNNEESFINWFNEYMQYIPDKKVYLYSGYNVSETSGVYVYENNTLGPAWTVCGFELYDNSETYEEVIAKLNQIDVSQKCLVNSKYVKHNLEQNEVDLTISDIKLNIYDANRVQYICNTDQPSILVTSDILYPGWKVYIDGKRHDILEVNYAFRGVYLAEGNHIVDFKFQPEMVFIGGGIGLVSIISCILLWSGISLDNFKKRRIKKNQIIREKAI